MPDVAWIRVLGPERQAWEPPRRLAVEHTGVVRGRGEWLLEPSGDGERTRFTWTESITMPPPGLGELALRLYAPWQRRMLRRSMMNLGRLLER
jgi:hypothetical protein